MVGDTALDLSGNNYNGIINGANYSNDVTSQVCNLTNINGCDSTSVLNLTIIQTPNIQQNDTIICAGDSIFLEVAYVDTLLNGFTYGGYYNGSHYFLSSHTTSWQSAKQECINTGGHLATIGDVNDNNFIASNLPIVSNGAWIGATDEVSEGIWQWVTGEAYGFTNWVSGTPNNHGSPNGSAENYAQMVGGSNIGQWNDLYSAI